MKKLTIIFFLLFSVSSLAFETDYCKQLVKFGSAIGANNDNGVPYSISLDIVNNTKNSNAALLAYTYPALKPMDFIEIVNYVYSDNFSESVIKEKLTKVCNELESEGEIK